MTLWRGCDHPHSFSTPAHFPAVLRCNGINASTLGAFPMLFPRGAVAERRTDADRLRRRPQIWARGAVLLAFIYACGTEPRIPAAIVLSTNALSFTALGEEQQLSPSITDQDGKPLPEETVRWSSSDPGVASVTQGGLVTALAPGSTEITAAAGPVSANVQVLVTQTPAQLQKISGDAQTGDVGSALTAPFVVQVNDSRDNPIRNATVIFTIVEGDGSVSAPTVTTGLDGRASTTFTSGTISGWSQVVSAIVEGTTLSVSFTAVAAPDPSSFNIGVRFLNPPTASQRQAFSEARLRWEAAITQDIEDGLLNAPAGTCGTSSPAVNQSVDDVLILVSLVPIDGAGGVLGGAGPCWIRDPGSLTIMGSMQFDTADLDMLEADGFLSNVILHEMGHVLGIGTLWAIQGFLADPSLPPATGTDPHFTGSQGVAAFDDVGGLAYVDGAKVPVENSGGPGTADGHWRESVLRSELMTGFIGAGNSPLSIVTLASLADQGYGVDIAAADSYSLMLSLQGLGAPPTVHLKDDILTGPIRKVDTRGRMTGEVPR